MKFNLLIHYKNDDEMRGVFDGAWSDACAALVSLTVSDPDFHIEDVQFMQVEPVGE